MIHLIVLLAISWLLVWLFNRSNISVLGLWPSQKRFMFFAILFATSAMLSATSFLLKMYFIKEVYVLSNGISKISILRNCWYQLRTVLTEELLCRGALLYMLIKKLGVLKAVISSSIFFALLHWFNAGVWGNFMHMSIIFTFTFFMGLVLAYAYAQSGSLLLPLAIHFGWNFVQNYIFPDSAIGNHLLTLATPVPSVTISYAAFFTMLLLPKISVIIINYFIVKQYSKQQ